MKDSFEMCTGGLGCTYRAIKVCNCKKTTTLLCEICLEYHIQEPGKHPIKPLRLTNEPTKEIRSTNFHLDMQESLSYKIVQSNHEVLQPFRNQDTMEIGLGSSSTSSMKEVDLDTPSNSDAAPAKDTTSPITPLNSVFAALNNTKSLMHYDIDADIVLEYDLRESITHKFQYSATCILPDGKVLIAGGYRNDGVYHGNTYRVDILSTPASIIKLSNLRIPRGYAKLALHMNYVYILGGKLESHYPNAAEMIRIDGNEWSLLAKMNERRFDFGVYAGDNRIYCIGGYYNTSIEYYDIILDKFELLNNIQVPKLGQVSGIIDEEIYSIGKTQISVFSKEFEILASKRKNKNKHIYSFSNIASKGKRIFYISNRDSKLYTYDTFTDHVVPLNRSAYLHL